MFSDIVHNFKPKLDFGQFDIYQVAESPAIELRLTWVHGINRYVLKSRIDYMLLRNRRVNIIPEKFYEMVETRDNHVEQIKYWTNCNILY